jgi:hypothetical protein
MVKMLDLLSKDEVLQQSWTIYTSLQTSLVFNRASNIRGQEVLAIIDLKLLEKLGGSLTLMLLSTGVKSTRVSEGATGCTGQTQERARWEQSLDDTHGESIGSLLI